MLRLLLIALVLPTAACAQPDAFRERVPAEAEIEWLADGFRWSEGPVWRPAHGDLVFSDVPANTAYRWSESDGLSVFLRPSGLSMGPGRPASLGSNGLLLDAEGRILIADHGHRVVARLDPETHVREVLASHYDGKRLNSPNDLALHSSGAIYFTDPPYGLPNRGDTELRELEHNGVYRLDPDGTVTLLVDDLTRPNGIILSPDERTLYVANSDPANAIWRTYPVREDGSLGEGGLLFDATALVGEANPGLPDGMAMGADGTVYATGPGGVLLLSPEGDHLGTIRTEKAVANCTFGDDGHMLYLTSSDALLRVRLAARGVGFE